jgi:thioredoxin 2
MPLHIVCPHCHATNRVPDDRLSASPNCGACHQPLFTAQPVELTETLFNKHIAGNDIAVLVDFWAPWCGPCRMMAPAFVQAAATLEPNMRLAKVNTEEQQGLAARYHIRSIPTLVLFKGGREITRQSGAMNERDIVRWARANRQ